MKNALTDAFAFSTLATHPGVTPVMMAINRPPGLFDIQDMPSRLDERAQALHAQPPAIRRRLAHLSQAR